MGARNSKQGLATFMSDYDVLQANPTQNITHLQHKKTQEEYLLREFTFNDKKQCDKTMEKLVNLQMKLKGCKHVVPLKDYLMNTEDQYCSTFYKIYALFQYPQRTLQDEINDRRLKMRRFSETQLWSILASCIVGLSHLQRNGIRHLALKSNRILLSREGIIKIADPFAIGDNANYDNALTKRLSQHSYLSPEQTQSLQQEMISPTYNTYKSDIFTLGMIVLQAGLFEYQDQQCYRDQKTRIHWQTVKYNIDRLGEAYSNEIMNMVEIMLSKDQQARPDWVDLQSHVMKGDDLGGSFIQDDHKNKSFPKNDFTPSGAKPISQQNQINFTLNAVNSSRFNSHLIASSQVGQGGKNNSQVNPRILPSPVINQTNQIHYQVPIYQNLEQNFGNYPSPTSPVVAQSNPTFHSFHSTRQTLQGFQFPPNQTNIVAQPNSRPVQNQIIQSNTQNLVQNTQVNGIPGQGITPLKISIIDFTRPTRNIFPADSYSVKTKFDQNLVVMTQDEYQTQSNGNFDIQNSRKTNNEPFNQSHPRFSSYSSPNDQVQRPLLTSPGPRLDTNNPQYNSQFKNSTHQFNSHPQIKRADVNSLNQLVYTTQLFKIGSRYEGYKLNGLRHGYGKFYYQDGGMYDGNWKQNRMEGHGKLYYQSGKLAYDGDWKQDKFMGKGTLFNETPEPLDSPYDYRDFDEMDQYWAKYEGQFQEDAKNGQGVLFLSNGERFQGNFISDSIEGAGIFYAMDGSRICGNWVNNKKN